jgi:hypothetical protein
VVSKGGKESEALPDVMAQVSLFDLYQEVRPVFRQDSRSTLEHFQFMAFNVALDE